MFYNYIFPLIKSVYLSSQTMRHVHNLLLATKNSVKIIQHFLSLWAVYINVKNLYIVRKDSEGEKKEENAKSFTCFYFLYFYGFGKKEILKSSRSAFLCKLKAVVFGHFQIWSQTSKNFSENSSIKNF